MNNLVILWGGADIDPSLYGEERTPQCGMTNKQSDLQEFERIKAAIKNKQPILGICRGAQLLNVFKGGKMIQHIPSQGGMKPIVDVQSGSEYFVMKAHHQVCIPERTKDLEIIAESRVDNTYIPEIMYWKDINAIGIQGHPEWTNDKEFIKYFSEVIKQYLGVEHLQLRGY